MATEGINGGRLASLTVTVDGDLVRLFERVAETPFETTGTRDRAEMFHVILPILYTNGTRTRA